MSERTVSHVEQIARPDHRLLYLYLLRCLLTGPAFPVVFLPSFFKYETLRYRFDDQGVNMSWGLLWRREIFLTYARIQDIHLSRGIFERWLGLGTILIQTAAGSASAEMAIVGLREYEDVRDFLYLRMRGARFGEAEAAPQAPVAAAGSSGDDEVVALLTEIRDEIRSLRAQRAAGGGAGT
jgi:putative membrane protein